MIKYYLLTMKRVHI